MSQPTPSPVRSRRELLAWRNAVFVIFILSGAAIATWVARIPGVRDGLGFGKDPSSVGLLILGMSVGAIVGLSLSSPVLVRFGPHKGMLSALMIVCVGLVLVGVGTSIAHSVPVVAIGLVLLGFGNGMLDVMMNVEGTAVEREIGKTLMPLMHAFFSLGTVIGAGIGAASAALEHRRVVAPHRARRSDRRDRCRRRALHPARGRTRRRGGGRAEGAVRLSGCAKAFRCGRTGASS